MTERVWALPPLAPDLEIADFDDELVALVPGERRAVHLEAGPALVVDSCRRGHARDDLIAEVAAATGTPTIAAVAWVDQTLIELARLGVVAVDSRVGASAVTSGQDPSGG